MRKFIEGMIQAAVLFICTAATSAFGATFHLDSPSGGERWMLGTTHEIRWSARGVSGQVLVEIVWRKKDGSSRAFASADAIPVERKKWVWKVPYEFPLTDSLFARITLHDPGQTTAKLRDRGRSFSVVDNPAPFIQLRSPVGGESWARGDAHRISWEARNISGSIDLTLEKDGKKVAKIATVPASNGHTSWTPPAGMGAGSGYTVTAGSTSASVSSKSAAFRVVERPPDPKEWTFLAYIGADNNLEECELGDFQKMASIGSDANVHVVAEMDRHPAFDTRFGNWTGARRYHIEKGMKPMPANALQDLGEINTASEERLADFLCWAMDHYPAKRYILLLSDHGYGWEPDGREREDLRTGLKAIIRDDTNGLMWISTPGLKKALKSVPSPIDIVGFDSCDMDMIEVAYQLKSTGTKVFIASQNMEGYIGWNYASLFTALQKQPADITERELGIMIVDDFIINNERLDPRWPSTHAALDLTAMDSVGSSIKGMVKTILADPQDKPGVRRAAERVISTMEESVIREQHNMYMNGYVFGTNIFFPTSEVDSRYTAKALDFVADTGWRRFLQAYVTDNLASTWIGKARQDLYEEENDGHVDLIAFCRGLLQSPGDFRVKIGAASGSSGTTQPWGSSILTEGQRLKIRAVPKGRNTRFVRWDVKGKVELNDPHASITTLTAHGNGSVAAVFSSKK